MSIYCMCQARNGSPKITAFKSISGEKFEINTPNVAYPMKCIKTGAPTEVVTKTYSDDVVPYDRNCDVYQCPYCGIMVAQL